MPAPGQPRGVEAERQTPVGLPALLFRAVPALTGRLEEWEQRDKEGVPVQIVVLRDSSARGKQSRAATVFRAMANAWEGNVRALGAPTVARMAAFVARPWLLDAGTWFRQRFARLVPLREPASCRLTRRRFHLRILEWGSALPS